ncbi:MAG: tRNA lysidine(34) synthetase TilS [Flavobacteriaceae bacterium]
MLQDFQKHIDLNFPFLKDKKLLIAISGGVDSVVLTHLCKALNGVEVSLAHCNFQLREKESDRDADFVKDLGEKLNLKTFITTFNTQQYSKEKKLSTQVAARDLRYHWFNELIKEHQFNYVLTAHHADDNLETFLINLTRGTGLDGLTGIPTINGNVVRPLLGFSRNNILDFANENEIEWREDASNSETKYVRNKIRHEVVPKLKEINSNLLDSFKKTTEFLEESQQIVEDRIELVSSEIISTKNDIQKINIKKLSILSNPQAYLYQLLKQYGFTEWKDVYNLLFAQSGKQVFSRTHRLLKDRSFLILSEIKEIENKSFCIEENQAEINEPIHLKFENTEKSFSKDNNVILVDKDLLKFPLSIRKWENGDYFCPSGMRGKKKLSKYFKDEKYSLLEKENTWLLCNTNNDIVWIVGKRQDNRYKATKTTTNILKITH